MIRPAFTRPILFASGILAVAAVAAAMRTTSWSPVDAFLELRRAPVAQQAELNTDVATSALRGIDRSPFGAYGPSAIGPGAVPPSGQAKSASGRAMTSEFAPDRLHGAYSASSTGPSASAGNLWRLLGLAQPHTAAAPQATHAAAPRQPAPPKPARTPNPRPSTGSHGSSPAPSLAATPAPATTVAVTAPVILIGQNPTPVSGLIGGGSSNHGGTGGTFAPGGHPPSVSGGGSVGLSATPEPSSVMLIGTGLIGLAALLRRRA